MAAERGMELPDVMRMMLTKAVRIGDFAIDQDRDAASEPANDLPFQAYEHRYWDPLKASLDAEAALALLKQAIADRTAAGAQWHPRAPQVRQQDRRLRPHAGTTRAWLCHAGEPGSPGHDRAHHQG